MGIRTSSHQVTAVFIRIFFAKLRKLFSEFRDKGCAQRRSCYLAMETCLHSSEATQITGLFLMGTSAKTSRDMVTYAVQHEAATLPFILPI